MTRLKHHTDHNTSQVDHFDLGRGWKGGVRGKGEMKEENGLETKRGAVRAQELNSL